MTASDIEIPSPGAPVGARLYRPAGTPVGALVWVHGGAFAWGDLDMPEADAVAGWLAERGWLVLSVDYRLAPEPSFDPGRVATGGHPFPAAHLDVIAAFDWTVAQAAESGIGHVFLGGASAGANLSAGAAVALRDRGAATPNGLLLAYPLVHATMPEPARATAPDLAGIPADRAFPPVAIRAINLNYVAGHEVQLTDPRAFPGEGDVGSLPRTLIVNSQFDDLRPSGERFAEQLAAAGVDVQCTFEPGTFHGHLNEPGTAAFESTLATFLAWLTTPTQG